MVCDCGTVVHLNKQKHPARAKLCPGCRAVVAEAWLPRNKLWEKIKFKAKKLRDSFKRRKPIAITPEMLLQFRRQLLAASMIPLVISTARAKIKK